MIRETADAPLRQRNSFHVEERAERLIEFDRKEDLDLIFGKGRPERWYVLGGGNNILFTRRFEGTLIKPAATGITVIGEDADTVTLRAEAATDWDRMVAWCVERGLWGAENLSLIPGTVGASPVPWEPLPCRISVHTAPRPPESYTASTYTTRCAASM